MPLMAKSADREEVGGCFFVNRGRSRSGAGQICRQIKDDLSSASKQPCTLLIQRLCSPPAQEDGLEIEFPRKKKFGKEEGVRQIIKQRVFWYLFMMGK